MTWQPIDTAPKDGTWILLWGYSGYVRRPGFMFAGHWDDYKRRWEHTEATALSDYGLAPTHWMPLPTPPGDESSCGCTNGCKAWGCDK